MPTYYVKFNKDTFLSIYDSVIMMGNIESSNVDKSNNTDKI